MGPGPPVQPQPGWGAPQPKKSSTPLILAITGLVAAVVGVVGFILISGDDDGENAQDDTSQDDGLTTREPGGGDPGTDPSVDTTGPPATDTLPATTEASTPTTLAADPSGPADGLGPDEVAEMLVTISSCEEGATYLAPEVQEAMLTSCSDGAATNVSSFVLSEDDSTAEVEVSYTFGDRDDVALVTLDFRDSIWLVTSWCYEAGGCWFP